MSNVAQTRGNVNFAGRARAIGDSQDEARHGWLFLRKPRRLWKDVYVEVPVPLYGHEPEKT